MHIDVNNAFLSWTAVELISNNYKIDIRTINAVIGGDENKRHGIVLAKSNSCKQKGIKTGESLYMARRKCKDLIVFSPNYNLYQQMSNSLFKLLEKYTPDIEILSIDECFLDYGKVKRIYGSELDFAYSIQREINQKLGFTVNVGIANNKLCAKMASDFSKPNKVHTLYDFEIKSKMWPLPVEELYGIGKRSSEIMHKLGINTVYDLAHSDVNLLKKHFKNQANKIINLANGLDDSSVDSSQNVPKGISKSTTLSYDFVKKEEILDVLENLVDSVSLQLRKQGKYANIIAVFYKDKFFNNFSHQKKLKNASSIDKEIYEVASDLFGELWNGDPIRLIGIRLENLVVDNHYQLSLFDNDSNKDNSMLVDTIIDNINLKYGQRVVKKANLYKNKNIK